MIPRWCAQHGEVRPIRMKDRPGERCPFCFAAVTKRKKETA